MNHANKCLKKFWYRKKILLLHKIKLYMKIFYLYTALVTKGGADRVITEKANWLVEHGFDVAIVTDTQLGRPPVFPLSSKIRLIDLEVDFSKEYGHNFLMRIYFYYKLMYDYRRKLEALLKNEKPDVVITTLGREIDFLTKIKDGSKKIGEVHTTKFFLRNFHLLERKNFLFKYLTKYFRWRLMRQAKQLDALVVLGEQHKDDWADVHNVCVIPNFYPFYPDVASSCDSKQVIMVGRYNDAKGYDYLIDAWEIVHKRFPDWTLQVYGSGEYYDQVVNWIAERNLGNSIILHEPTDNIMEKYLESSICVMSSRYEGFSMVLVEAMASGVPCVSFDCPYGPRNIIRNEEDGLLVDYLNSQALADGLCRLIEDENLRKRLGRKARENIKRFSKDEIMDKWSRLFYAL